MSRVGVGVDFGTSNSAAAIFDGESVRLVQLESDDSIVPSATYIDRSLTAKTGQLAVDQYIADNTGRTVELIPQVVGETSQFVDDASVKLQHAFNFLVAVEPLGSRRLLGVPILISLYYLFFLFTLLPFLPFPLRFCCFNFIEKS